MRGLYEDGQAIEVKKPKKNYKPKRGDVVIFRRADGQQMIKKVAAVPGDTARQTVKGLLVVNEQVTSRHISERICIWLGVRGNTIPVGKVLVMPNTERGGWGGPVSISKIIATV